MAMPGHKLLLTGATGYVGGSVLHQLMTSSIPEVTELSISVLVRKQEQADLFASKNLKPILFRGLEDTQLLRVVASEHDVVIHTASSTDAAAADALIRGVADRGAPAGRAGLFMHLSGTSSLGDRPFTKPSVEPRHFSDRDDVYGFMKELEAAEPYKQRATDIKVVETGEQLGVQTRVLKAPRIYGRGTGSFSRTSFHIPAIISGGVAAGQVEYVGDGAGIWDDAHVADVARYFELLLAKFLRGESSPSGAKGIYFVRTTRHSWRQLAEDLAKIGYELGLLESSEPRSIGLPEAAEKYTGGDAYVAEVGLASNSLTHADRAAEIGWTGDRGEEDFQQSLLDDFQLLCSDKLQK